MKQHILITDAIERDVFEQTLGDGFSLDYRPGIGLQELKQIIGNFDIVIAKPRTCLNQDVLRASRLTFIGIVGNGTENVDMACAKQKDIEVFSLPEESVGSVAELVVCMLGNLARCVVQASQSLREGRWEKERFLGCQLREKTLGVLGLGRIGRSVATLAKAFSMTVIGYDPYVTAAGDVEMVKSIDGVLGRADFITVHVPLMKETDGLIGQREIACMKDGVFIVNASRARIFEYGALLDGLMSGKIAGYATDVHYQEPAGEDDRTLLKLPHVIATPHIGAQTREAQKALAEKMALAVRKRFT